MGESCAQRLPLAAVPAGDVVGWGCADAAKVAHGIQRAATTGKRPDPIIEGRNLLATPGRYADTTCPYQQHTLFPDGPLVGVHRPL